MSDQLTEEELAEARADLDREAVDPMTWAERAPGLIATIDRLTAEERRWRHAGADGIDRMADHLSKAQSEVERLTRLNDDFIATVARQSAEIAHLRSTLEIVDPPEEPMPAVALDGERCECCGRAFTPGEQVASFAAEDVVTCYGPCPEPEMWRVEYEYLDTEEAQRRVGGRGPMPYEEAVVIGGNFRRLPLVNARVRLVRVKEPRRG